uniref:Uncharacterized protein n=1 Tax=Johanseniella sp. A1345 TaxID=380087 RepID=A4L7C7_9NOST|nr:hypothetical protein [Johanseniella A1345]
MTIFEITSIIPHISSLSVNLFCYSIVALIFGNLILAFADPSYRPIFGEIMKLLVSRFK